jgi:hypothetical protein
MLLIIPVISVAGNVNIFTVNQSVDLKDDDNNPPYPPNISGPTFGKVRDTYEYEIILTDPDEDDLMFYLEVDFGDGEIYEDCGCDVPWYNGTILKITHRWKTPGNYVIKARVQDGAGEWSNWSDPLTVTMPKTRSYIKIPFLRFLENHPHFLQVLLIVLQRFEQ